MAYNTTPTHGKKARVEKNDVVMAFTGGWNLNTSVAMADVSAQGDDWETSLAGLAGATGTFTGSFVPGNTEQKAIIDNIVTATPGVLLTDMILLFDGTTSGYTGDMFITDYAVDAQVGDRVFFTATFKYNGALAISDSV
jgi:hypothetical protein